MGDITLLLQASAAGDAGAHSQLYERLYGELTRLARGHLADAGAITLDPPALVHESWLRASGSTHDASHRRAFFAFASAVMRSVIVDHVRRRTAEKRGGGAEAVTLSTSLPGDGVAPVTVIALDTAMRALARVDERCHRVVEMRCFGGLELEEIADVLGVSTPTVKRDWRRARAYLYEALHG